jgi:ABC-type glycerol-3-phosphate transport system substrate-binding protein
MYAVPYDYQPLTVLVNPELFDQYGLSRPSTWDELRESAKYIQEMERESGREGFYGVGLTSGIWSFLPFLYQAGGSLIDEDGRLALDTDPARDAFRFYTALARDGLAYVASGGSWPYWGAYGEEGVVSKFAQGDIAVTFGGPGIYDSLRRSGAPVEVIEPLAKSPDEKRATVALVRGYGLFADPQEPDAPASKAAVELIRFLTSEEAAKRWIGDGETPPDYIPAQRSVQKAWEDAHPDTKAFVTAVDYLPEHQVSLASFQAIRDVGQQSSDIILAALQPDTSDQEALDLLHELQVNGSEILRAR